MNTLIYVLSHLVVFEAPVPSSKVLVFYCATTALCIKFIPWYNWNLHHVCPCFR